MRRASVLFGLLLFSLGSPAVAETPASDLYVRDARTIEQVVQAIRERAVARGSAAVLFVFDSPTFAPPSRGYYAFDHDYGSDTRAWLDALSPWAAAGDAWIPLHIGATLARRPAGRSGPALPIGARERRPPWPSPGGRRFASNPRGPAVPPAAGPAPAPVTLALVTVTCSPSRKADPKRARRPGPVPPTATGTYWDEEEVGAALSSAGTVSRSSPPRRGSATAFLRRDPDLPWVSRPGHAWDRAPAVETPPGVREAMPRRSWTAPGEAAAAGSHPTCRCGSHASMAACSSTPPVRRACLVAVCARRRAHRRRLLLLPPGPAPSLELRPFDSGLMAELAPEIASRRECLPCGSRTLRSSAVQGRSPRHGRDAVGGCPAAPRHLVVRFEPTEPPRPAERFVERNKPRDLLVSGASLSSWEFGKQVRGRRSATTRPTRSSPRPTRLASGGTRTEPAQHGEPQAGPVLVRDERLPPRCAVPLPAELTPAAVPEAGGRGGKFALTHLSTIRLSDCSMPMTGA